MKDSPPGDGASVHQELSVVSPEAGAVGGTESQNSLEAEAAGNDDPVWGLSTSDRWLLIGFAILSLALLSVHAWRIGRGGMETVVIDRLPKRDLEFQIDINRATWVEWMQLEDVGEILARRIVTDREENGPFKSVDDVQRVKGIGPVTLKKIRPHLMHTLRPHTGEY